MIGRALMQRISATEVVASQRAHRARLAAQAMHRVASAARLHRSPAAAVQGAVTKQETPGIAVPEGLYRSRSVLADRRAASAHSDTTG